MAHPAYQVAIIGGGVSGAALAYVLTRYTGVSSLVLVEKSHHPAAINSAASQNSQTLHYGDIETNYSLEKAAEVKHAADMLVRCVTAEAAEGILHRMPKMVLGVGETECAALRERHGRFQALYPDLHLLDQAGIAGVEPDVAGGRREELAALASPDSWCAVDFGRLTRFFLQHAQAQHGGLEVHLSCRVRDIARTAEGYVLHTSRGALHAQFVAVCAGAHSLGFAQNMGYGWQYSILPVAGSFFHARCRVRGKVYTVQSEHLPFAALHADPDIEHRQWMRLGPTALLVPFLERRRWSSVPGFLRTMRLDAGTLDTFTGILGVAEIRRYMARNLLYEIPLLRAALFAQAARKILPALRMTDLRYARGVGGLRPQLIDRAQHRLVLGAAAIDSDEGLLFNITPSPGATMCLANAIRDASKIAGFLGCVFNGEKVNETL
ncbi:MAG TPA: FAD-dependent oxidoreductase [Thiobacillus sp.]|nr:FAD-dependent oxidoreductase [Thiobacillus sp.]